MLRLQEFQYLIYKNLIFFDSKIFDILLKSEHNLNDMLLYLAIAEFCLFSPWNIILLCLCSTSRLFLSPFSALLLVTLLLGVSLPISGKPTLRSLILQMQDLKYRMGKSSEQLYFPLFHQLSYHLKRLN